MQPTLPVVTNGTAVLGLGDRSARRAAGDGGKGVAVRVAGRHHGRTVRRLDRPVLHDDQYGTAVVALAALLTAMRRVGGKLEDRTVGQVGMGAAGIGIARLLKAYGVRRLLGTDLREDSLARLAAIGGGRAGLGRSCATRTWSSQRPVCKGSSGRSGCARASSSLRSRTRMQRSSRSRRSITGPRLRPMARA